MKKIKFNRFVKIISKDMCRLIVFLVGMELTSLLAQSAQIQLNEQQKQTLTAAKTWRVVEKHDYPGGSKVMLGAFRTQLEKLLRDAGWGIAENAKDSNDVTLCIQINGTARSQKYGPAGFGIGSTRYSGADISVSATIDVYGFYSLALASGRGYVPCPYSLAFGYGYTREEDAPFDKAFQQCEETFRHNVLENLFTMIYQCRGRKAMVQILRGKDYERNTIRCCLRAIQATGDRDFLPLLLEKMPDGGYVWQQQSLSYVWQPEIDQACETLGALGDERAIAAICENLLNQGEIRSSAVLALEKIGNPKAIPPLREILLKKDPTAFKTKGLVATLENLKWRPRSASEKIFFWLAKEDDKKIVLMGQEAVPILLDMIKQTEMRNVAKRCVKLLGDIKEKSAIAPLCSLLINDDDESMRAEAATSLSKLQSEQALAALSQGLSADSSEEVRVACAKGLGENKATKALRQLCRVLVWDKAHEVARASADALGQIGDTNAVQLLREDFVNNFCTMPASRRELLTQALESLTWKPETTKEVVLHGLALRKEDVIVRSGKTGVPVLAGLLQCSNDTTIVETATRLLGQIKDPGAGEPVAAVLRNSDGVSVRSAAAESLGQLGGKVAIAALREALLKDSSVSVRVSCVKSLGGIDELEIADPLCQALQDQNDSVVKEAARALIKAANRESLPALFKALNYDNTDVRSNVVQALVKIGDTKAVPILKARLEEEKDNATKKVISAALIALGVQAQELPFMECLDNLAKRRQWEALKLYLEKQPTNMLIDALQHQSGPVKRTALDLLKNRTDKWNLGDDYITWQNWWEKEGKAKVPGGKEAGKRSN